MHIQMPTLSRQSGFVILPFFLWGTAMVVMKAVMPQTSPLFLAAVRLIPAGVLLVAIASWQGRSHPQGWRAWGWIVLFALVDGTMFQGCLALGLVQTSAGLGSLLIDSQPLAVAVMAALFYQERIGLKAVLGLIIGVIGIGLIGLPPEILEKLVSGDLVAAWQMGLFSSGEWLMLGASLSMALGTILIRPVVSHTDPVMATGWHMILGGLPLFVFSAQFEQQSQWQDISAWGWLGMAYMTIMGSAIAYGLFFYFASSGNLTTLSALTFSTPVFALLFGRIFLSESLTLVQWLGVSLTLVSIYLVSVREFSAQEPDISPTNLEPKAIAPSNTPALNQVNLKEPEKVFIAE
jgi:drug/metabolite transporter (DMT)-like permease